MKEKGGSLGLSPDQPELIFDNRNRWPGEPGVGDSYLGWTDGRILDFSFGGRSQTAHEIALESVSRNDFR